MLAMTQSFLRLTRKSKTKWNDHSEAAMVGGCNKREGG
jgi:hypothetical protein